MEKPYERTSFIITAFDVEDVITTSGGNSSNPEDAIETDYGTDPPFGAWW